LWNVTQAGSVYYMRENQPETGPFDIEREDVKQLGIFIATTGLALLVNAEDTLTACQMLAASRPHEYGGSGPVDVVQLLPESEGMTWLPEDEFEMMCDQQGLTEEERPTNYRLGLDMWIDDEGLILDKHYNPFASLLSGQDIYGDVIIWGCRQGETVCIPFQAFDQLCTAEWMTDGQADNPFILRHPISGWWTLEEARIVVDSLNEMGRIEMSPDIMDEFESEEEASKVIGEQHRRNNAARMFATVGFEASEYGDLMKAAQAL